MDSHSPAASSDSCKVLLTARRVLGATATCHNSRATAAVSNMCRSSGWYASLDPLGADFAQMS
jgi:hypothetical protein